MTAALSEPFDALVAPSGEYREQNSAYGSLRFSYELRSARLQPSE